MLLVSHNVWYRNDGQGNSGLKYIMDVVKRLLDPAVSDSAALYVGTLVSKLIQVVSNFIVILNAMQRRVSLRCDAVY